MSEAPIILSPTVQIQAVPTGSATQSSNVPQAFANLPNGTTLKGFVINRDAQSNPIIRTDKGDVLVKSDFFLKTGSEVVIRIQQNVNTGTRARLVSVDGLTPQQLQEQMNARATKDGDAILRTSLAPSNAGGAQSANAKSADVFMQAVFLKPSLSSSGGERVGNPSLPPLPPALSNLATRLQEGAQMQLRLIESDIPVEPKPGDNRQQAQLRDKMPANAQQAFNRYSGAAREGALPPQLTQGARQAGTAAQTALQQATTQAGTVAGGAQATPTQPAGPQTVASVQQAAQGVQGTTQAGGMATSTAVASTVAGAAATQAGGMQTTPAQPSGPQTVASAQQAAQGATQAGGMATTTTTTTTVAGAAATQAGGAQNTPATPSSPQTVASAQQAAGTGTATTLPAGGQASPGSAAAPTAPASSTVLGNVNPQSAIAQPGANAMSYNVPANAAASPATQTASVPNAPMLQGVVVGTERGGETIVQTPLGTLKLFTSAPPPPGSTLRFEVVNVNNPTQASSGTQASAPGASSGDSALKIMSSLSRDWQSLSSIVAALQMADTEAASRLLNRVLPNTNQNLTQGVLFFLSALKGGDVRQWLGNRVGNAAEKAAGDAVRKLGGEMAAMRTMFVDASPEQPWQTMVLPLVQDEKLHTIRMHVREDFDDEGKQKQGGGQRFVVEVELTQLGEMQFDGFIRKAANAATRFDLVIRTRGALPEHMQQDIQTIFGKAAEATRFEGTVSFQENVSNFRRPMEEIVHPSGESDDGSILA